MRGRNRQQACSTPAPRRWTSAAPMPVTLDDAIRSEQIKEGDLVVLAGFGHAGDYAGAAAIRWGRGR
nr:hypothetical protein OG409_36945 [Streptomyces sp. NBC_00974]